MPRWLCATGVLVAALLIVPFAQARHGTLDRDFGVGGLVRTDVGPGEDSATSVAALLDGRILVAGTVASPDRSEVALARYTPRGRLDPSFGTGGVVRGTFGGGAEASSLAMTPAGQILVTGSAVQSGSRVRSILVARYDGDGRLDRTFGERGRVFISSDPAGAQGRAIAVAPDGSAVVVGSLGVGAREQMLAARLDPSGRLDTRFGTGGITRIPSASGSAEAFAVALRDDGGVVLAGRIDRDLGVVLLEPGGEIDPGFGDRGMTRIDAGGSELARALVVQPDGALVVAGTTFADGESDFLVARLRKDGKPDASFAVDGVQRTDLGGVESARALVVRPDGTVVVAGQTTDDRGSDLALAAFDSDGELVAGFGRRGHVRTDLKSEGDAVLALAVQQDGKIVAAGVRGAGPSGEMALVRYREGPAECGDGYVEGAESCDLGPQNGRPGSCCSAECTVRSAGETCRAATGLCDLAEVCDGASPACPADAIRAAEFECRPALGWCDLAEQCSGASKTCPEDRVRDRDAVCRAAVGPCDASELCDGEDPQCPEDAKSTAVCRAAQSDCDLPEVCDGKSDECPGDQIQENGNACYDRNPCTTNEVCQDGACVGGTFDPFECAAMLCRRWEGELISNPEKPEAPMVRDQFEEGRFRIANAKARGRKRMPKRRTIPTFFCERASLTGETWGDLAFSDDPAFADAPALHSISVAGSLEGELVRGLIVSDRFGRRPVTIKQEQRRLSVPARVVDESGAHQPFSRQRRKCYSVGSQPSVGIKRMPMWIGDEPLHFDVRRLRQLCVPVVIDGQTSASTTAIACYGAKRSRGEPAPERIEGDRQVESELGYRFALRQADTEFVCVPATVEALADHR